MGAPTDRTLSARCTLGVLAGFGLVGGILLAIGGDHPNLHIILDTGVALLSAVLVLLLWDIGSHLEHPFPQWLAISFASTAALELLHALVAVNWSGPLTPISQLHDFLRPATWPPAAHVLPLGIVAALALTQTGTDRRWGYGVVIAAVGAALLVTFQLLPPYTPPGLLGVTRPALAMAPLLWLAVGAAAWRLRTTDRLIWPLIWMTAPLLIGHVLMLYSRAPADSPAMVAHLGKLSGYLVLLLCLMQLASSDMAERIRAEMQLARSNETLERQVIERTRALSKSEQHLKQAQRLARMGSFVRDLRTDDAEWSDETYRIFGVSPETPVPSTEDFLRMVHPDDRATVLATQDTLRQGVCPEACEYRIIRSDGTVRQIYRENALIRDEAGHSLYLAGTVHDVTEQRRIEDQLRQAQKMEAIGNLTGGMAHDFNNLLGIIVGNLDLARDRTGSDAELREMVGEALDAALRGADLTRRLLAFARRQPLRPARIDVNEFVADTVRLLRRLLGEDIEISLSLAEQIWPVSADPAQLEASLANLATNARDAMAKGGRLIITTANRHLDADYAQSHADVTPGDFAMIEVTDSGTGMSAETMSQIFEPFFTTKEPGKGTGLGLSMVFGFLRQSGGNVNVYSEPGVGTTFRLYLPRIATEASPIEESGAIRVARGAGETVLVVEDNPAVLRTVLRQLREFGYRVLECDRAAVALELLEHEPVDLLFTDIVMPGGLDGIELACLAAERWPTLKIVLTSGFPQARVDGNGERLGNSQLLSKPYRKDELAAALRAALDR